jgi:soluble lytic murein transglycosylase-like protein
MAALLLTMLVGGALPTPSAFAQAIPWHDGARPCWEEAGARHGIDPWLLYATAFVESQYQPDAISRPNRNGTRDIGLMQINSTWLPTLRTYGIPSAALVNACASTYIGAWIMAKNFRRYGYSWQAIAAYNVGSLDTPERRAKGYAYARKVYAAYAQLTRSTRPTLAQAR